MAGSKKGHKVIDEISVGEGARGDGNRKNVTFD